MPGVMDPNNPFRVAMRGNSGYQPPRPTRPPVVDTKPGGGGVGPTDPPEPGGGPKPAPTPSPAPVPGAWTPEMQARAERLRQWATDPRRLATVGRRADGSIAYDPQMYGSNYRGTNLGVRVGNLGTPQWGNAGFIEYDANLGPSGGWVPPYPSQFSQPSYPPPRSFAGYRPTAPSQGVNLPQGGSVTSTGTPQQAPVWIPVPGMPGGGFYQAPGGG